jgi:ribosomal protein L30
MATTKKKSSGTLKIKWVVSFRGLGFRRMQQVIEHPDTPTVRGMIAKVHHLVKIEES